MIFDCHLAPVIFWGLRILISLVTSTRKLRRWQILLMTAKNLPITSRWACEQTYPLPSHHIRIPIMLFTNAGKKNAVTKQKMLLNEKWISQIVQYRLILWRRFWFYRNIKFLTFLRIRADVMVLLSSEPSTIENLVHSRNLL